MVSLTPEWFRLLLNGFGCLLAPSNVGALSQPKIEMDFKLWSSRREAMLIRHSFPSDLNSDSAVVIHISCNRMESWASLIPDAFKPNLPDPTDPAKCLCAADALRH